MKYLLGILKRFIKTARVKILVPAFYRLHTPTDSLNISNAVKKRLSSYPHNSVKIVLATIAFNNPEILSIQINALSKNLIDPFLLLVFDNSSDNGAVQKNMEICRAHDVPYVRLPRLGNAVAWSCSVSHALALNWAVRFVNAHTASPYIGIIDHDVFPPAPTSICDRLTDKRLYGLLQSRKDKDVEVIYYWPGFLFLQRELTTAPEFDFLPTENTDTGGRLAFLLTIPETQREHAVESYITIRDDITFSHQHCTMSRLDDWIHTRNASYWHKGPRKEEYIQNFLKTYSSPQNERN